MSDITRSYCLKHNEDTTRGRCIQCFEDNERLLESLRWDLAGTKARFYESNKAIARLESQVRELGGTLIKAQKRLGCGCGEEDSMCDLCREAWLEIRDIQKGAEKP